MKYAIVIPDGCADEPQESLGGRTPLEAAHVPHMDAIAAAGVVGRANHVPASLPPGSDVANLSLFGYDPLEYFTGRAPLEAAAQGIALGPRRLGHSLQPGHGRRPDDARFHGRPHLDRRGHGNCWPRRRRSWAAIACSFIPGVSYRNLLVYRGAGRPAPFGTDTRATPPHDLTDKSVLDDYPAGREATC